MLQAEVIGDATCELGESPLWDPDRGELLWIDITGARLHRLHIRSGTIDTVPMSATVTAIGLTGGVELVAATAGGFGRLDPDGGTVTPRSREIVTDAGDRMNDGAVAPDGSFWAGSCVGPGRVGDGALWRWRGGEEPERMLGGVTISNGLDWLAGDPQTMLYVDSASGGIDCLTLSALGDVSSRRRLVDVDPQDGEPDGLCLDQQDLAWVAIWGAGEIRAYDVSGRVQDVIAVPARHPSSCIFGGEDRRTLYITSARQGLSDHGPLDGRLFACRLPVPGCSPRRFGPL